MESTSRSASLVSAVPRHPSQPRQQARRKFSEDPSLQLHVRHDERGHAAVPPPASPEVISSLITSLSIISKPAHNLFDGQPSSVSAPATPGSFGVEYSAFLSPPLTKLDEEQSLDDLAACPPVVRTSKPPSGFSQLTAQKSPRTPKSPSRDLSSSLRSLLRSSRPSSRPSSRGSEVSSHDDSRSVGNLSVERSGSLRRQDSQDSWGRLTGRKHKGLMYMSSKERLRASSTERKRASVGAVGGNPNGFGPANAQTLSPDPFFAETPISEEPAHADYLGSRDLPVRSPSFDTSSFPAAIPARESSLRKTGSGAKRSSQRRSKREADAGVNESIPEHEEHQEHHRARDSSTSRPQYPTRHDSHTDRRYRDDLLRVDMPHSTHPNMSPSRPAKESYSTYEKPAAVSDGINDGAPFPAVYSNRRRSAHSTERRRSGRLSGRTTPEPGETLKKKRSSSRLTRLSAKSPEPEERPAPSPEPNVGYERPRSTDSVDDAVESYLCSPRLSQKIKHPQTGRVISFSEVGDSEGSAVFCCVGMGLTRYITAFYDELALTLKLRLITPDRPGVGDSEPYTDGTATPLSWPDDVYAICQTLKITKFSMLAHSAGAIYALATALRMPQHIRGRIHLLAPWIPPSQMNVFGGTQAMPPANAIPTSQRILRALPTPFLKAANSSFMSATSSSITSSLPKTPRRTTKRKSSATTNSRDQTPGVDKENMPNPLDADRLEDRSSLAYVPPDQLDQARPRGSELAVLDAAAEALADQERQSVYDNRLTHAIWDLATTGANPAVDLLVCLERRHTIGFRYVDITRPVVLHHGSRDTRVPVENVKWLGKTMRRCEVRVLEGEGHGLMASASVMGSVLMEISKEWEDWMRVTGTTRRDSERERGRSSRAGVR